MLLRIDGHSYIEAVAFTEFPWWLQKKYTMSLKLSKLYFNYICSIMKNKTVKT